MLFDNLDENKRPASDDPLFSELWRETGGNAVVVTDVGQHQMWEAQYYKHNTPRSLITSGGLGTMGFGLPAAIGAKMARPDAEVIVLVGDGSYLMLNSEIATSVLLGRKLIVVVLDNRGFGCINRLSKLNPALIAAWSEIMNAVPGSRASGRLAA